MCHDFCYLHELVLRNSFFHSLKKARAATKINLGFPRNNYIENYMTEDVQFF